MRTGKQEISAGDVSRKEEMVEERKPRQSDVTSLLWKEYFVVYFLSGALKHLSSLQVLLLHNNQLKHLDKTVKELTGMISLQTLSNALLFIMQCNNQ